MNILDVGCGAHPRGTVNIDVSTGWNPQTGNQKEHLDFIDPHRIPNFVLASAEHLPFKTAAFEKVVSSQVIEHVHQPYLMLKEMVRVARKHVALDCPHRFGREAKMPTHKHVFNKQWFLQACQQLGVSCHISTTSEALIRLPIIECPLKRVSRIIVTVKKRE